MVRSKLTTVSNSANLNDKTYLSSQKMDNSNSLNRALKTGCLLIHCAQIRSCCHIIVPRNRDYGYFIVPKNQDYCENVS